MRFIIVTGLSGAGKSEATNIKKLENSYENKQKINNLYNELYEKQFQQDYLMLIMDSPNDYR